MNVGKWLKRIVFGLVVLVTLLGLALAIENYRGRRAWEHYLRGAEARGERYDFASFLPARVPDDQNFAKTPLLAPFLDGRYDRTARRLVYADSNATQRVKSLFQWRAAIHASGGGGWRVATPTDLAAWQQDLRRTTNATDPHLRALMTRPAGQPADDLLFLLNQDQAVLDELRRAAQRPRANFNLRYEDEFLSSMEPLPVLKSFANAFQARALAELSVSNVVAAADDTRTALALSGVLKAEPLLIAGLVRLALLEIAIQPLWEGLARRQWSDAQLREFETVLREINLIEEMGVYLRGERAFSLALLGSVTSTREAGVDMFKEPEVARTLRRYPSGWRFQNQLAIARMYDEFLLPVLDATNRTVNLRRAQELTREFDRRLGKRHPYTVFAAMLMPAMGKATEKAARSQATVALARVACALERFRLAQGQYPDTLQALTRDLLDRVPVDPATGDPLHYRRTDDGRFVLYSAGLDGQDNGGRIVIDSFGKLKADAPGTDWVWKYPG